MSLVSLALPHLSIRSAEDVHELFNLLGYDVYDPQPFEGDNLDEFELDEVDAPFVERAYVVTQKDNHVVYLFEVSDLRQIRLRGLAWNVLQRGTALLVVTRDYKEIVFVDPRFVGNPIKSNVRVNKLKVVTSDPTRHDLDTLNAIHAHHDRTGEDIYIAQAEAFNVTKTTKRFYDEYRHHYEHTQEAIRHYNRGIREFQDEDQHDKLHAFTQRLLGRLMFLYFLQRKGWLGHRQKFLTEQFRETMKRHSGEVGSEETFYYYREVLEPLFFETMNTKRPDDITLWGIRIPYLNGGLFDQARDPEGTIVLPDSLFDPHSSDGLLAFFNRYNFTVADDTPLEQDVAVDPEMLGKVFENMLEERDRGQTGSFYTPRTIVSYMCQEALAGYLEESGGISREETRQHFDPDVLSAFTEAQAERVERALDTLTVLDPAVGSGSFLIGMMQEIVILRRAVAAALHQHVTPNVVAEWKEQIIRDTLYGVDIKPEAIEIAQLRLWLSLVVNQTLEQAHPLPNLDYKLMAGNSLIETIDGEPILSESAQELLNSAATPQQPQLFDMSGAGAEARKLEDLRDEYFHATPEQRRQLATDIRFQERRIIEAGLNDMLETVNQRIAQIERKYQTIEPGTWKKNDAKKYTDLLTKRERLQILQNDLWNDEATLPFFLYRLHFNDVFAQKGGFDIVVANPPYVRMGLFKDEKEELKATYPDVYAGRADLLVYFYARGIQLLKNNGQLSFITSNKYLRAGYGKGLRKHLSKNLSIRTIVDFGDLPIFEATAYPCVLVAEKKKPNEQTLSAISITDIGSLNELQQVIENSGSIIFQNNLSEDIWQISNAETQQVINKLRGAGGSLDSMVNMFMGLKTGRNKAFVISKDVRQELIDNHPSSADLIKPWLRGRQIKSKHGRLKITMNM